MLHNRPARTALFASAALLGGLLTAVPAAEAAPRPPCKVTEKNVDVDVSPTGTAQTSADWEIHCSRSVPVTTQLRVCSPKRYEAPARLLIGNRVSGSTNTVRQVDPEEPLHTAVLDIRADGKRLGEPARACARATDGKESCYTAGRAAYPDAGLCGG